MQQNGRGTVIVTGGARGIGAAVVTLCAQAGHDVLFSYARNRERAEAVVAACAPFGSKVAAIEADARDAAACEALVERATALSDIVGLVNNAGVTSRIGSFLDVDVPTLRDVLDVNVLGTMLMCQSVIRYWTRRGSPGAIVNVSSIAATLGAPGEYIHYAGSKAAVEGFTVGLANPRALRGAGPRRSGRPENSDEAGGRAAGNRRGDRVAPVVQGVLRDGSGPARVGRPLADRDGRSRTLPSATLIEPDQRAMQRPLCLT